jgi:hypothetical protein
MPASLASSVIEQFARVALANVATEYPFHLAHLARSPAEVLAPRRLHPVFFGAYDWHSCVHMHWTLARCLKLASTLPSRASIVDHFDRRLTPAAVEAECDYFTAAGRGAFERPYGWGWLLQLWAELDALGGELPAAARWRDALAPLAELIADRLVGWLPRAEYPVRAGTHGNSAFALVLAHRYAVRRKHAPLGATIADRAQRWFAADRAFPADYEPSGDDFLSGGLCEALLMMRVLPAGDWRRWWTAFAPAPDALARWLAPVAVADAADPKIVHLHGLNLSRAWCWRQLLPQLPAPLQRRAEAAADVHLRASLSAATAGDYVGTHWLASFALLALTGDST